jgi:hypothetical protein
MRFWQAENQFKPEEAPRKLVKDNRQRRAAIVVEQGVDTGFVAQFSGNFFHLETEMQGVATVQEKGAQPVFVEQLEAVLGRVSQYPEMTAAVDDIHRGPPGNLFPWRPVDDEWRLFLSN